MGQKHTKDDKIIDEVELENIQREANGHVSMWIKMLGMGEAWGHEGRIRESLIQHSCVVPPMKLLVKDHKPLGADGLPPTRPVVGASRGVNVALSNILSDVIEPVSKTINNPGDVISSEHLLSEINKLNKIWANQKAPPASGVSEDQFQNTSKATPGRQSVNTCATLGWNLGVHTPEAGVEQVNLQNLQTEDSSLLSFQQEGDSCALSLQEENSSLLSLHQTQTQLHLLL